jgi:hypothetical protein
MLYWYEHMAKHMANVTNLLAILEDLELRTQQLKGIYKVTRQNASRMGMGMIKMWKSRQSSIPSGLCHINLKNLIVITFISPLALM